MMKKILGLTIAFMLLISMGGIGTWAYFQDTETSTGNVLTAGTLDLKTDNVDGVTQTLYTSNLKPGDDTSGSITLKNTGSVAGSTLDLVFSYIESDNSFNSVDKSAYDTATVIELTTLNLGGSSLLSSVSDANLNGYRDIEDLKNADLTGQSGINPSATQDFTITVQLRGDTTADFQSDGINITITFTLNQ
ncbi:TasA family protein [Chloroflexota bacterium]